MNYHRKLSLTSQWQFLPRPMGRCAPLQNCHWLVNDSFCWDQMGGCAPLQKCHWPVNDSFGCDHGRDHGATCTFRKCHWPVNDSFSKIPKKMCKETVIDWSMTVWVTNIARTYGHVSLTPVNDTKFMDICHWLQSMTEIYGQTCQKVSLTAVNDKKKCHWLDVYYVGQY